MINPLLEALKANDIARGKKARNYFEPNASVISYSTGLPTLDYLLGYKVYVNDIDGNVVDSYPSLGITAGSFVLLIGNPGVSKTSFATKVAGRIVHPFDSGLVFHIDIEGSMNYSRIQALTKLNITELRQKYILRQEKVSLEDVKGMIVDIYLEKTRNKDKYTYDTGKKNEFGDDIRIYVPTVFILDSIATVTIGIGDDKKTIEKMEEVMTQTDRMRLSGEITRFINELLPICKEANIIVLAINQIKKNPGMGIIKVPGLVLGLKQDETVPGGLGQLFNAQILLKFVSITSEKYNIEDDGFSGFGVRCEVIKSRVSSALQTCNFVFDRNSGPDIIRSNVMALNELGLVGGNRAGYYFIDHKEHKFTQRNMIEDFRNDPELHTICKDLLIPALEPQLSGIAPEELMQLSSDEEIYYTT